MKVLIVNASDAKGGAAVVARRLLHALNAQPDVEAKMLVAERMTNDPDVVALPRRWWLRKALDRMIVWVSNGFSKRGLWLVDGGFFGNDITQREEFRQADVIHLHWVNQGFLGLRDIEKILHSGKKVVWTLHDLWPIVGVCHLPYDCAKYKTHCEACQYTKCDFSKLVFDRKHAILRSASEVSDHNPQARGIRFVAVSQWVDKCFQESALLKGTGIKCSVINNLMPVEQFSYERKPRTSDEIVLTMGAARLDDPVKGFPLLLDALQKGAEDASYGKRLRLILYGGIKDKSLLDKLPVPCTYKGILTQEEVAETFRESDVVLSCSAYETFGATLAEGIASGCLAVTRGTGGQRDVVEHGKTGYIVEEGEDFVNGILWAAGMIDNGIHTEPENRQRLHDEMLNRFSSDKIVKQYLEVYK